MISRRPTSVLVLLLAFSLAAAGQTVSVEFLQPPGMPASVEQGSVSNFQDTSLLTFTLRPTASVRFEQAHFDLYVVDSKGKVRFGQGWQEKFTEDSESKSVQFQTQTSIRPGERVLITVSDLTAGSRQWRITATGQQIATAIATYLKSGSFPVPVRSSPVRRSAGGGKTALLPASFLPLAPSHNPDYCEQRENSAYGVCHGQGKLLGSFSCNGQTHSYSYTCVDGPPPEDPPEN
jgi:hypothetical protein